MNPLIFQRPEFGRFFSLRSGNNRTKRTNWDYGDTCTIPPLRRASGLGGSPAASAARGGLRPRAKVEQGKYATVTVFPFRFPFRLLAMLLEKPGELVTREELQARLWPQTIVDFDHGLNKAISLAAANAVIALAPERYAKDLWTDRAHGNPPALVASAPDSPLSRISCAATLPRPRFSRVPGMFGSLEVKVLYPT